MKILVFKILVFKTSLHSDWFTATSPSVHGVKHSAVSRSRALSEIEGSCLSTKVPETTAVTDQYMPSLLRSDANTLKI